MNTITRAEFDESMEKRLTETRAEVVSALKEAMQEKLDDLKVDLLHGIDSKVSTAKTLFSMESVQLRDLKDAKVEILATTRRNTNDAVAPLEAKMVAVEARMVAVEAKMDAGFSRIDASHQAIDKSIKDLTHFVTRGLGVHENRLKDQEALS